MSVISYTNFHFFLSLQRKLLCAKFTTPCNSQNLKFKIVNHCHNGSNISINKLFDQETSDRINRYPKTQLKTVFLLVNMFNFCLI